MVEDAFLIKEINQESDWWDVVFIKERDWRIWYQKTCRVHLSLSTWVSRLLNEAI